MTSEQGTLKYAFCAKGGKWPQDIPFVLGGTLRGKTLVEVTERNTAIRPGLNIWYVDTNDDVF